MKTPKSEHLSLSHVSVSLFSIFLPQHPLHFSLPLSAMFIFTSPSPSPFLSGAVTRDWVGYPRRFFSPGTKEWRCACVRKEDLDSPHMKFYPDCDPNSFECKIDPKKIKELRKKGL